MGHQGILVYKWEDFTIKNEKNEEEVITFSNFQSCYGKFEAILYSPENLKVPYIIWTKDKAVKIENGYGMIAIDRSPTSYCE